MPFRLSIITLFVLCVILFPPKEPFAEGFSPKQSIVHRRQSTEPLSQSTISHQGMDFVASTAEDWSISTSSSSTKRPLVRAFSSASVLFALTLPLFWVSPMVRRNMFSGTLIFALGDSGAQLLEHQGSKWDKDRLIVAVILGALWAGWGNPLVYSTVERYFPGNTHPGRTLLKMVLSCSVLTTFGNYFTMMFRRIGKQLLPMLWVRTQQLQQQDHDDRSIGQVWQSCMESTRHDFPGIVRQGVKVWPLYDFLCFSVIPPSVRPISTAIMASLWSMYLSMISARTTSDTLMHVDHHLD